MKYILRKNQRKAGGVLKLTLSNSKEWCLATDQPMRFFNPRKASVWALNNLDSVDLVYVEGPNGGQYRIMNGRIKLTGIRKGWGSL